MTYQEAISILKVRSSMDDDVSNALQTVQETVDKVCVLLSALVPENVEWVEYGGYRFYKDVEKMKEEILEHN